MPSVVTGILGGDRGSVSGSTAGFQSDISRSVKQGINFLKESRKIDAGGFSTRTPNKILTVSSTGERKNLINTLSQGFTNEASQIKGIRSQLTPGFSAFRKAGLSNLRDQRRRVVGDLRDNLARRRISGSSFAADAVSRAEAEFQKREDEFTAQTFLQELDAQIKLIEKEGTLARAATETLISELNLQADLGVKLTGQANAGIASLTAAQTSALTSLAGNNAAGIMQSQQNTSDFIGDLVGIGLSFI